MLQAAATSDSWSSSLDGVRGRGVTMEWGDWDPEGQSGGRREGRPACMVYSSSWDGYGAQKLLGWLHGALVGDGWWTRAMH